MKINRDAEIAKLIIALFVAISTIIGLMIIL